MKTIAEKEYIEREALIDKITKLKPGGIFTEVFKKVVLEIISNQPTADVQEVRHGEWLEDDYGYCRCSNCRYEHDSPECITPYCPECGTKMDEE